MIESVFVVHSCSGLTLLKLTSLNNEEIIGGFIYAIKSFFNEILDIGAGHVIRTKILNSEIVIYPVNQLKLDVIVIYKNSTFFEIMDSLMTIRAFLVSHCPGLAKFDGRVGKYHALQKELSSLIKMSEQDKSIISCSLDKKESLKAC